MRKGGLNSKTLVERRRRRTSTRKLFGKGGVEIAKERGKTGKPNSRWGEREK